MINILHVKLLECSNMLSAPAVPRFSSAAVHPKLRSGTGVMASSSGPWGEIALLRQQSLWLMPRRWA